MRKSVGAGKPVGRAARTIRLLVDIWGDCTLSKCEKALRRGARAGFRGRVLHLRSERQAGCGGNDRGGWGGSMTEAIDYKTGTVIGPFVTELPRCCVTSRA